MAEDSLRLYVSGGRHITNVEARIDEIESEITPELIFAEEPGDNQPAWRVRIQNFITATLLITIIFVWSKLILRVLSYATSSADVEIVRRLKEKHDAQTAERGLISQPVYESESRCSNRKRAPAPANAPTAVPTPNPGPAADVDSALLVDPLLDTGDLVAAVSVGV